MINNSSNSINRKIQLNSDDEDVVYSDNDSSYSNSGDENIHQQHPFNNIYNNSSSNTSPTTSSPTLNNNSNNNEDYFYKLVNYNLTPQTPQITIIINILPWINEPQEVLILNSNIEIGDLSVFFKEKGTRMTIRELPNYSLFKIITSTSSNSHSSSKKKLLLSNDQQIKTYNLKNNESLELIPNYIATTSTSSSSSLQQQQLPRWFYKVIVPSIELEGILRDLNSHLTPTTDCNNTTLSTSPSSCNNNNSTQSPPQHFLDSGGKRKNIYDPFHALSSRNAANIQDIIQNIKSNKLLTIESPTKRGTITNSNEQLLSSSPTTWNYTIPSSIELPEKQHQHSWLHTRRVYDVVQKIESEFPYVLDNRTIDSTLQPEDKWEARINSSDETFIKTLTMQDSLGSELSKQEYIEFSLRFQNRTCLLMGIEYSFTIWIDPIQSFFTLSSSSNTTIRDAVYFILQYLFPNTPNDDNDSNGVGDGVETFMTMVPYYALYLQELKTTKLIPLQHKQLLLTCNPKPNESVFIFKKKKNLLLSKSSDLIKNTSSLSINSGSNSNTNIGQLLDEDEGYNLTVLFPTKHTYRQFHFIPTRTVNETIKSILDVTAPTSNSTNTTNISSSIQLSATTTLADLNNNQSEVSIEEIKFECLPDNNNSSELFSKSPPSSFSSITTTTATNTLSTSIDDDNLPHHDNQIIARPNFIFDNQYEASRYCLYFQKNGSGVWMEGNRTLISYNLPNETVVEFKPPPSICKLSLIEGISHCIRLYCKSKVYTVVIGKFTTISELEELIGRNIDTLTKRESESFGLFLVKYDQLTGRKIEICLSSYLNFQELPFGSSSNTICGFGNNDYLEFKESTETNIDSVAALAFASMAKDPPLIPGEVLSVRREGYRVLSSGILKQGILMLSNYRLIFHSINRSSYIDLLTKEDCDIPLTSISRIKNKDGENKIEISCKEFKVVVLQCVDFGIWNTLKQIILSTTSITRLFAFKNFEIYDKSFDVVYNVREEFERLQFPKENWRITSSNSDYSLCPTYPSEFIVPIEFNDEQLKKVSLFREKGRVPAICWIHRNHNSTITRCSQPRVGLARARCSEDEEYLNIITKSNTNSQVLYVMDSRPMANAKANTLLGKGHENTSLYQNVELQFLGIGNIHVMRDSYKKLYILVTQNSDSSNWLSQIDNTQWLEHIYQLINSSLMVVELVDKKGSSVLTHCSDGWDRTSQLVSLAQLLLDPYYRTIKGFEILIEKEWLAFGHLFTTRSSHIISEHSDGDEFSPIFLLFIDAVWQLTNLLPTTFQFNEKFLIKILDSVYSCRYKQFLFNNEKERLHYQKLYPSHGLVSLWSVINSNLEDHVNSFYIQDPKPINEHLFMSDIQFWSNYYMRWNEKFKPKPQLDNNIIREIEKILKLQQQK